MKSPPRTEESQRRLNGHVCRTKPNHWLCGDWLWSTVNGWAPLGRTAQDTQMTTKEPHAIPDRSSPGLPTTASSTAHQGGGDKCATGVTQIRGRENITIGTWNVRTLCATGRLQELTHEMARYQWNILGLCEMRWKSFGENMTDEGHKIYLSGRDDRHEQGVGLLVHKDIVNCVLGCQPVSSRIITLRMRAKPFNITVIQAYVPTTNHSDNEVEDFYDQLQEVISQTSNKDILIVQGDWNAEIGKEAKKDWPDTYGEHCNEDTNDRGIRLLEFANYNNLILANTLGPHKSCINIARRSFPGADIGSDHDLLKTFHTRLKKSNKPKSIRLKFDLDRLRDPDIADSFKAMIGGKFAPLLVLGEDELNLDQTVETVLETANQVLGKRQKIRNHRSPQRFSTCATNDENWRKRSADGAMQYQDQEIHEEDLTNTNKGRVSIIQDKAGKCLTEEQGILSRWTEYCSELYNHSTKGDPVVLNCPPSTNEDTNPILREEVEATVKSLKKGKSPGVYNISAELIQAGGEAMIDTGEWPTCWTQSLVITLPKKGNLQKCQNYRTISLIGHASKVMLRILLNRLKPQAETIIAEEQSMARRIANLIRVIEHLYDHAASAVLLNGNTGKWFRTVVGVRQGCLLSPTLFNIFLERLMTDVLEDHEGWVSIGGRIITNLRFTDNTDGLAGREDELNNLVKHLDKTSQAYDTGSKKEILARIAQSTAALTRLKTFRQDKNISLASKTRLLRTLVISIFLYACESWTLNADTQRRVEAHEMRCYRKILSISYKDHITNEEVRNRIYTTIGEHDRLLSFVKKRKMICAMGLECEWDKLKSSFIVYPSGSA
ncbi:uncharacterized protein LOC134783216 [Penaeus indicus]|uniref:uncharacterized protein LOC134783216 n=1 Tax=Penaeus indicus TaxID=29960 RepID=UPI00300D96DB